MELYINQPETTHDGTWWSWSYGSWIYNYLLWFRISHERGVLNTTLYDIVCQWLASGRWFSPSIIHNWGGIFILRALKIRYMLVFCLFTLGRHGNFTVGVTMEQPDLLCTALALNIELLSIIMCAVL